MMKQDTSLDLLFEGYSGFGLFPKDDALLDKFIRYSVGLLQSNSKSGKALDILLEMKPERCANYVVGALQNPHQADYTKEYLLRVGSSKATANPLVGALGNENSRIHAEKIIREYGLDEAVSAALVGALGGNSAQDTIINILKTSIPTNYTYKFLSAALSNPAQRIYAKEVFIHYGHNVHSTGYVIMVWEKNDTGASAAAEEILLSDNYGRLAIKLLVVNASKNPNSLNATLRLISEIKPDVHAVKDIIRLLGDLNCSETAKFMLIGLRDPMVLGVLAEALKNTSLKKHIEEILQF